MRRLSLLILALTLLLVACDEAGPSGPAGPAPNVLIGVQWSAISISGRLPVPGSEPTIAFSADRVRGSGGCNQFGGRYRYDPSTGAVAFDEIAMTAMGCLNAEVSAIETTFAQALTQANRLDLDADGRLRLTGPGGALVFAKVVEG